MRLPRILIIAVAAITTVGAVLATPWLGMVGALLLPGTATYDPEFAGRTVFVLGLHGQVFMAIVLLLALLVATAAVLRSAA
ncbi:hypothetical protein [Nonomuraea sp. NPDC049504]|uniref:hypothetical protein n=1 Tax=Nonomuraea sp. NPDC049504 TaxID=3154729 RepID=UPI00344A36F9